MVTWSDLCLENNSGCSMENDGLVGNYSGYRSLETNRIKSRDDGILDQDYCGRAREKQKEECI